MCKSHAMRHTASLSCACTCMHWVLWSSHWGMLAMMQFRALLFLSHTLKRCGPLKPQGLCSHPIQLWATSEFVPRTKALGSP